ncbi:MAG: NAD-dependent epimerase/dehydratase family protein [Bacteroidales bacterium]|nr:NAD-dependent epimerase/dehydratase family protein [Bacteroidales bacterium]
MEQVNKKILVTGGTGFVGGHLLYHLAKSENSLFALKRKNSSTRLAQKIFSWYPDGIDLFNKIKWIEGDITDKTSLEKAFENKNQIYHAAGLVSFSPSDRDTVMEINADGTRNVVNTALEFNINKLCYVSSIAAIGRDDSTEHVTEETPWNNNAKISGYARSKYEAEREVWRGIAEGLKAVIVNPSIILGPGNWNSGSVKMFQTVYKGLKYYTSGTNGYIDVNDLTKVMIELMNSEISDERFIVNSENVSYKHLFTKMAKELKVEPPQKLAGKFMSELVWRILKIQGVLTGKKPLITKETARTANTDYFYSNEKIRKATCFDFMPVDKTIEYTARIYLKELNTHIQE